MKLITTIINDIYGDFVIKQEDVEAISVSSVFFEKIRKYSSSRKYNLDLHYVGPKVANELGELKGFFYRSRFFVDSTRKGMLFVGKKGTKIFVSEKGEVISEQQDTIQQVNRSKFKFILGEEKTKQDENRLAELVKKIRILSTWTISYCVDKKYMCQCTKNVKNKFAIIYAWDPNTEEPADYLIHEILHIAMAEVVYSHQNEDHEIAREKEETLIQDICTNFMTLWPR